VATRELFYGESTINWLCRDQLRVDPEWSLKVPHGFTWWADRHAQTVEVIGSEIDERDGTAYLVAVRTDLLRKLELTDTAAAAINALLMCVASMAGPVYNPQTGALCARGQEALQVVAARICGGGERLHATAAVPSGNQEEAWVHRGIPLRRGSIPVPWIGS
jgi:hypothetical protein